MQTSEEPPPDLLQDFPKRLDYASHVLLDLFPLVEHKPHLEEIIAQFKMHPFSFKSSSGLKVSNLKRFNTFSVIGMQRAAHYIKRHKAEYHGRVEGISSSSFLLGYIEPLIGAYYLYCFPD